MPWWSLLTLQNSSGPGSEGMVCNSCCVHPWGTGREGERREGGKRRGRRKGEWGVEEGRREREGREGGQEGRGKRGMEKRGGKRGRNGRDRRERGERSKRVEGGRKERERGEEKGERRVRVMVRKGKETDFCTHYITVSQTHEDFSRESICLLSQLVRVLSVHYEHCMYACTYVCTSVEPCETPWNSVAGVKAFLMAYFSSNNRTSVYIRTCTASHLDLAHLFNASSLHELVCGLVRTFCVLKNNQS